MENFVNSVGVTRKNWWLSRWSLIVNSCSLHFRENLSTLTRRKGKRARKQKQKTENKKLQSKTNKQTTKNNFSCWKYQDFWLFVIYLGVIVSISSGSFFGLRPSKSSKHCKKKSISGDGCFSENSNGERARLKQRLGNFLLHSWAFRCQQVIKMNPVNRATNE